MKGFRLRAHSPFAACCPIVLQKLYQVESVPKNARNQSVQPCKTMGPLTDPLLESQKHVEQQGSPQLPFNCLSGIPEKIADLQSLLDLLEECLDCPAAGVQIADAAGSPFQVVGEKNHDDNLTVFFDFCFNPAQAFRILFAAGRNFQRDLIVYQHFAFFAALTFAADMTGHVL